MGLNKCLRTSTNQQLRRVSFSIVDHFLPIRLPLFFSLSTETREGRELDFPVRETRPRTSDHPRLQQPRVFLLHRGYGISVNIFSYAHTKAHKNEFPQTGDSFLSEFFFSSTESFFAERATCRILQTHQASQIGKAFGLENILEYI